MRRDPVTHRGMHAHGLGTFGEVHIDDIEAVEDAENCAFLYLGHQIVHDLARKPHEPQSRNRSPDFPNFQAQTIDAACTALDVTCMHEGSEQSMDAGLRAAYALGDLGQAEWPLFRRQNFNYAQATIQA